MDNNDLNELLELISENKTLRAELKEAKQTISQYQKPTEPVDIPGIPFPDFCRKQAGDEIDMSIEERLR